MPVKKRMEIIDLRYSSASIEKRKTKLRVKGDEVLGYLTPQLSSSGLNQPFHSLFGHSAAAQCLSVPAVKAPNGGAVHSGWFPQWGNSVVDERSWRGGWVVGWEASDESNMEWVCVRATELLHVSYVLHTCFIHVFPSLISTAFWFKIWWRVQSRWKIKPLTPSYHYIISLYTIIENTAFWLTLECMIISYNHTHCYFQTHLSLWNQ